jgi:hypothetical protein
MTAPLHFLAGELAKWDGAGADAIALAFFSDERPLRGAAGLVDWRLCGRLSRLLKAGKLSGRRGETLMLPPAGRRLTFPRVFLFGLGDSDGWSDDRYRQEVRRIRDVLHRAGIVRYAVQPPGRATGLVAPRRALELWLDEAHKDGHPAEVTLIESPSGQKEMAEALRSKRLPGS